jgi:hypothetical protein
MCSLQERRRVRALEPQSGFLLNSSNDRRALDGVVPNWDARGRNLQITHTRPVGKLFPVSPKPPPTISTEQNSVGRLIVSLISRRARASLFELDGGLFSRNSQCQMNAWPRNPQTAWDRELKLSAYSSTRAHKQQVLRPAFQERQLTTWQKN